MNRRKALKVAGISTLTTIGGLGLLRSILVEIGFDLVKETRTKMCTLVTISLVHKDIDIAKTIIEEAFLEIDRLEGLFSSYREGTPLWVLNSEGVLNDPSPEILELLGYALEIDSLTDGAFDVTVASLSDLYSETFEEKGKSPSVLELSLIHI